MAWPAIGRRVLAMMRDVLDHRGGAPAVALFEPATAHREATATGAATATGEPEREEQLDEEPTPIA
jgi:hypothetical protein